MHVIVLYEPDQMQPRAIAVGVLQGSRIEPRNANVLQPSVADYLELPNGNTRRTTGSTFSAISR